MNRTARRFDGLSVALALVAGAIAMTTAQTRPAEPLSIARQGYLFAGGKYSTVNGRQVMSGQLYAEFQIPSQADAPVADRDDPRRSAVGHQLHRHARWPRRLGAILPAAGLCDLRGRSAGTRARSLSGRCLRSSGPAQLDTTQRQFTAPERYNRWPQAHLHTQWPGTGVPGDPVFDQFYASQMPSIQNFTLQQELNRDAIVALLEKIGPSILLTHSQSGAFGWPVADARPDLVKAILAVEPNGPPFFNVENVAAPEWFRDDTAQRAMGCHRRAAHLLTGRRERLRPGHRPAGQGRRPGSRSLLAAARPARSLPNLQKLPILVLTAEASYHAPYDHCTVQYLEQAGVHPTWVKLADVGLRGNGHMMMLEKNNLEIAGLHVAVAREDVAEMNCQFSIARRQRSVLTCSQICSSCFRSSSSSGA